MQEFALVFDHDGTLVDSEQLHFSCWREIMLKHKISISEAEYIRDHNGIPTLKNAEVFIKNYDLLLSPEQLCMEKQTLFANRSAITPSPLLATVQETLQTARAESFPMAVATGADNKDVQRSIAAHSMTEFFDAVATRSDVKSGKPAPDVYLLACERLKVEPNKAVAFEDTAAGILSAKTAGLLCIAIPNAYSAKQDLSLADAECASLWEAFVLSKKLIKNT